MPVPVTAPVPRWRIERRTFGTTWMHSPRNADGSFDGGWTDAALQWWLGSANNTWTNNPHSVVTVYGNKSPRNPWANANGARDIGNELRTCHLVGLSIRSRQDGAGGTGGHAITAWGDDSITPTAIITNPGAVRLPVQTPTTAATSRPMRTMPTPTQTRVVLTKGMDGISTMAQTIPTLNTSSPSPPLAVCLVRIACGSRVPTRSNKPQSSQLATFITESAPTSTS